MKIYQILIVFLLLSCNKNEKFISEFSERNKIPLINLSEEIIPASSVINEYDEVFLNKYNFPEKIETQYKNLDLKKINLIKSKRLISTKISIPIFSNDNKYCLIQVNTYVNNAINSDIIYLLKKNKNYWVIEDEMESILSD